jgi:mannose-6-phosphate isomerase-like protein (cupin superfamily)
MGADGSTPVGNISVQGPGQGRTIPLGDAGTVTMKVDGAGSGGSMSIYEFQMPARTAGPPEHLHRGWDEAFYVLDGTMTFLIEGETRMAPAGSCVFVPHGVLHTFWNQSDVPARQLTMFTPAGIEDYFDALTRFLSAGTPEELAEAERLMADHDMVVPHNARPAYGML